MDRKRRASEETIDLDAQRNIGESIRSLYDLARPLPDKLDALIMRLDNNREREASGGLISRPILNCLIIGTVLIVGAFAVIYYAIL
jgi:hypothetical protein